MTPELHLRDVGRHWGERPTLQRIIPLPAADFYKPEGLAFLPNGDLLISSEGDKKGLVQASVLRFAWRGR